MPRFSRTALTLTLKGVGRGPEDPEQEAKSVASNTQELAKDAWPCPLRGKKFRAEFVHTHRQHARRED